ncbi:hypothetical protein ACIQU5_02265 [Streptomyces sp. NPDC090306]|uniref:hypothetical protein n=1 Tax=Streptomyces sp. NPDC090306 TaxID=3365961 RepID=UPI003811BF33
MSTPSGAAAAASPGPAPQAGGAPAAGDSGAPAGSPAGTPGADGGRPAAEPGAAGDSVGVGAGHGASEATARTGQGSLRAGMLRAAWTHVGGDQVEGDKIVITTTDDRGVVLRTLTATTVETVRHAFREPPRWDDILADAWQRRSVVLRGPRGAGKTGAAVRLLLSGGAKSWFLLDSVADLARLTELDGLGEGAGLLLDRPRDLGDLRGGQLAALEDLLETADARLVVIAAPEAELGHGVGEYVQRVARPDSLDAVLAAHLGHRLGESEAGHVLASEGVADLAAALLDAAASCRDAARLAEVLAHESSLGTVDLDRVRSRMDQTAGESPEEWFEGLGDTVLRTQATALAVLGGLPQEDVALAASTLLDRFRSDRGVLAASVEDGPVPLRHDPFSRSRRLLAERLRARTVSTVTRGAFGTLPCTVAEYRDAQYPPRIIRHVWSEYFVQAELIDWIAELVDSPSQQVRSFAGTALGLIATESFDHIATQVFPRWIRNEDRGALRREAVAYALRVCVRVPALRPGVRALVEGWYLNGDWHAQAAAARAYGLCLGGVGPEEAVRALTRLGTVDHMRVAIAIGDAFADLMEENLAAHAPMVLRAVAEMVHDPASRACGHLVFLILADALVADTPAGDGLPARSRPTLLLLAAENPADSEIRRVLGYLWAEVIGGELFGDQAARVLEGWSAQAEADPLLLDQLVRVLVDDVAARGPRVGRLLQRYADQWTDRARFRRLPRVARVLGAALLAGPSGPAGARSPDFRTGATGSSGAPHYSEPSVPQGGAW